MIEKIEAQIIATTDEQSFKQAGDKAKTFARDTGKELDKSFLFKLQLDKANTKIQLEEARKLLRRAKKDGDKALVLKMTIKTDKIQRKLTESGRILNNYVNTGNTKLSRLGAHFDRLGTKINKNGTLLERLKGKFKGLATTAKADIGGIISKFGLLAIAMGVFKVGVNAIALGDKLEQANISFETMLGSATKAKKLLGDLALFASNTPFELIGIRDTAKQLLAYGINGKKIIPTLKALGDVSAGLSVPIQRVALAYGQVKVAGKLMGQDLLQFTSAGVPLIAELAKNLGVTQASIKTMVSQGKISFADVNNAFKTMTEEGGKFANLMSKQTVTLSGKWSNLKDTTNLLAEKLGTALLPVLKKLVDVLSAVINGVVEYSKQIGFLLLLLASLLSVKGLLGLYGLLIKIIPAIRGTAIATTLLSTSINLANFSMKAFLVTTGPLLLIFANLVVAIGAVVTAYEVYSTALELIDARTAQIASQNNLNQVFKKGIDKRKKAIKELQLENAKLSQSEDKNAQKFIDVNNKKIKANKQFILSMQKASLGKKGGYTTADSHKNTIEGVRLLKEARAEEKKLGKLTGDNGKKNIKTLTTLNAGLTKMKNKLQGVGVGTAEFKKLQTEIKKSEQFINSLTKTNLSGLSKINKAKKQNAKKEIQRQKRFAKYLDKIASDNKKAIEKRAKILESGGKAVKGFYGNVRDEIDKTNKTIVDLDKAITNSTSKIKKLNESLATSKSDTGISLYQRKLDLIKKIRDLEQNNAGIKQTASLNSVSTFEQVGKGTIGGISGNKLAEYKKLVEERQLIDRNANLITEENKKKATQFEAQNIIDKAIKHQAEIDKAIKEEQVKLDKAKKDKLAQQVILKGLDDYRTTLEKNYTTLLAGEVTKRIGLLEKMRQKAIDTANAMAKAGMTTNNTNVNVNLNGTGSTSADAYTIANTLVPAINKGAKHINN